MVQSYETTEQKIKREFEAYGPIKRVNNMFWFVRCNHVWVASNASTLYTVHITPYSIVYLGLVCVYFSIKFVHHRLFGAS